MVGGEGVAEEVEGGLGGGDERYPSLPVVRLCGSYVYTMVTREM